MPENAAVVLVPGTLPEGYCLSTFQRLLTDFFTLSSAYLPGNYSLFNFGNSEPAPSDRGKPWIRLNNDGSLDRTYVFFMGDWLAPYETPPSSSERRLWVGLEADLETYDGGEAGAVSDTTGPFWTVDHLFDARVPIGPGTFTADPADPTSGATIAVGGTGGRENSHETLVAANVPPHQHTIGTEKSDDPDVASETGRLRVGGGLEVLWQNVATVKVGHTRNSLGDGTGGTTAMTFTNLPPYFGTFVIKRTARIYRRAIP